MLLGNEEHSRATRIMLIFNFLVVAYDIDLKYKVYMHDIPAHLSHDRSLHINRY